MDEAVFIALCEAHMAAFYRMAVSILRSPPATEWSAAPVFLSECAGYDIDVVLSAEFGMCEKVAAQYVL